MKLAAILLCAWVVTLASVAEGGWLIGPQPAAWTPLAVYDARGRSVGVVVSFTAGLEMDGVFTSGFGTPGAGFPLVVLRRGGVGDTRAIVARVGTHQFLGTVRVVYAQPECQGQPYLDPPPPGNIFLEYGVDDNQRLYIGIGERVDFQLQSFTEGAGCINTDGPIQWSGAPGRMLLDLSQRWTPPFTVR